MSIASVTMTVSSAPDVITTMVGWAVYDGIWGVLSASGLLLLPFIGLVLSAWTESRERLGDDNGGKAALLVLETRGVWMLIVLYLAGQPAFELNIGGLGLHRQVCTAGTTSTRVAETGTGSSTGTSWDNAITTLGTTTVQVPIWWAVVNQLAIGLNNAAIASIPCTADVRSTVFQLNSNPVSRDADLTRDLADFAGMCFGPALGAARNDIGQGRLTLTDDEKQDLDWLGSGVLNTSYYPNLFAKRGVAGFAPAARQPEQFYEQSAGVPPDVGRPSCSEWWSGSGGPGLRARIVEHINKTDPDLLDKARGALCFGGTVGICSDITTAENAVIRSLLEKDGETLTRLARSAPGAVKSMDAWMGSVASASVADYNDSSAVGAVSEAIGVIGAWWQKTSFLPMVTLTRAAALPLQAITGGIIIIALPLILLLSSYSVQTLFTVTFGVFGVKTWTVIWAFARFMDDSFMQGLRSMGLNGSFLSGAVDVRSLAIDFLIGLIYIGGPAIWVGLLGWAGWNIGNASRDYMKSSEQTMSGTGNAGGRFTNNTISTGRKDLISGFKDGPQK